MAMTEAISTTVSDLPASKVDVAIDLVQNGSKASPGQLATKHWLAKTGTLAGFFGDEEIECIAGSASNSFVLAAMCGGEVILRRGGDAQRGG